MTINEIRKQKFSKNQFEKINFGVSESHYWIKLKFENTFNKKIERLLEIGFPLLDYVSAYFYKADEKPYKIIRTGDLRNYDSREVDNRNFVFRIDLKHGENQEVYLHIHSVGTINIPLLLHTSGTIHKSALSVQFMYGVFYGIMSVIFCYHFILFIGLRNKYHFYYICVVFFSILSTATINTILFEYITKDFPLFTNILLPFTILITLLFLILFSQHFLDSKTRTPKVDTLLNLLAIVTLISAIMSIVIPSHAIINICTILAIIVPIALFLNGVIIFKTYKPARLFVLAWTFPFFGIMLYALREWSILSDSFLTAYSMQIGVIVGTVLHSSSLAYKVNILRRERLEARNNLIAAQKNQSGETGGHKQKTGPS